MDKRAGAAEMVKVKLTATLKERLGAEMLEIDAPNLKELAKRLSEKIPDVIDFSGNPSPLYLFLIDGVDARVLGENPSLDSSNTVIIIPVNHGG